MVVRSFPSLPDSCLFGRGPRLWTAMEREQRSSPRLRSSLLPSLFQINFRVPIIAFPCNQVISLAAIRVLCFRPLRDSLHPPPSSLFFLRSSPSDVALLSRGGSLQYLLLMLLVRSASRFPSMGLFAHLVPIGLCVISWGLGCLD